LPQRLDESPSTVTVIDRAMIEASGARRLVDVLRLVPGFQVGYKNNSLPTAAYHGLSDEYARRTCCC
jgi:iron complex outermembrane receptor protein